MNNFSSSQLFYLLAKYIPSYAMHNVQEQIEHSNITEQQVSYLTMDMKDPTISIILSVLVGSLGIDRFYIGDIGLGLPNCSLVGD